MRDDDEIVEIARFSFLHEAQLAASVLDAAEIECIVRDQFVGGARPELIFTGNGFRLLVRADQADDARELLDSPAVVDPSDAE